MGRNRWRGLFPDGGGISITIFGGSSGSGSPNANTSGGTGVSGATGQLPLPSNQFDFADDSQFKGFSCTNNPAINAGVNLAENLAMTKFLVKSFKNPITTYQAYRSYMNLVHSTGWWDYKNRDGVSESQKQTQADAGNVNFGYTCAQFPTGRDWLGGEVCMYGAGKAQHDEAAANNNPAAKSPYRSYYHGDLPRDNYFVRLGIWLAKQGC